MGKVSIKKNVKPKKVAQKQKQKQIQKVTINIGSQGKKAVTRSRKQQSQLQKQTIKPQPISQPSIISYNQPIFKQPIQPTQPSSLASSILASQLTPNVVAQEKKEESTINRALQEQITNESDPERIKNDLERTKKKVKIPTPVKPPIIPPSTETNSIRRALLSQRLDDQGDDTEEISALKSTVPYVLGGAGLLASSAGVIAGSTIYDSIPPIVTLGSSIGSSLLSGASSLLSQNPLTRPIQPTEPNPLTGSYQQPPDEETKDEEPILEETKEELPIEDEFFEIEEPPEQTILQPPPPEPTILQPVQPEPTILQPEPELPNITDEDFNKYKTYTQEVAKAENKTDLTQSLVPTGIIQPIQNTESILQSELIQPPSTIIDQSILKEKKDIKKNPSLLEPSATKSSLTQALQAEEPAGEAPLAESRIVESNLLIKTPAEQTREKWEELQLPGGPLEGIDRTKPNPKGGNALKKSTTEWLNDIHGTPGNENWKHIKPENRPPPGPKKKPVVAEEIPPTILEVGKPIQPTILEVSKPPPTILEGSKPPPSILQEDISTIF